MKPEPVEIVRCVAPVMVAELLVAIFIIVGSAIFVNFYQIGMVLAEWLR